MATYSIKDLELISGIKAHTIRIWEKRYGLVNPSRTSTNIRYYNDDDLRKLLNVSILTRNGLKISKISCLASKEMGEKVMLYAQKNNKKESIIENLVIAMIELDEIRFDKILSNAIIQSGFEETFINILNPFFERVGMLWQTGTVLPAQEHFISNLIRQKLIVAIDNHHDQPANKNSRFFLFLPDGDWHELGLLFYHYVLRKRGYRTIYFGQSLPVHDLVRIIQPDERNYYLVNVTIPRDDKKLIDYFTMLSSALSNQTVFVSGNQVKNIDFGLPQNIKKISNPGEFIKLLELLD
jgi:MerR family transcriptional regulator, light-induced transcriptional regulator